MKKETFIEFISYLEFYFNEKKKIWEEYEKHSNDDPYKYALQDAEEQNILMISYTKCF